MSTPPTATDNPNHVLTQPDYTAPAADTARNFTEELLNHALENKLLDPKQSEAFRRDMLAFLQDKALPVSSSAMMHTVHRIANQQGFAMTQESVGSVVHLLVGEVIAGNAVASKIAALAREYGDPLTDYELEMVRAGNVITVQSRPPLENLPVEVFAA